VACRVHFGSEVFRLTASRNVAGALTTGLVQEPILLSEAAKREARSAGGLSGLLTNAQLKALRIPGTISVGRDVPGSAHPEGAFAYRPGQLVVWT